jgi:hypothetical protein
MIARVVKYHSIAEWNFSLWFTPLSPLIPESRHKDENDKSQTNQRGKAKEMVSIPRPAVFA